MNKNIFRADGRYLGFIKDNFLYSRDWIYMGWLDGQFVWDKGGFFRGTMCSINGNNYILADKYTIPPTQRTPRISESISASTPPPNIAPITLPTGEVDAFISPRS